MLIRHWIVLAVVFAACAPTVAPPAATPSKPVSLEAIYALAKEHEHLPPAELDKQIADGVENVWNAASPELVAYLDENRELLSLLRESIAPGRPRETATKGHCPGYRTALRLQRLLVLAGRRLARERRDDEALETFVLAMELAHRHLSEPDSGMNGSGIGWILQDIARKPIQDLIYRSRVTEEAWIRALASLEDLRADWRDLDLVFEEDLCLGLERVRNSVEAGGDSDETAVGAALAAYEVRCERSAAVFREAYALSRPELFFEYVESLAGEIEEIGQGHVESRDPLLKADLEALFILSICINSFVPCLELDLVRKADLDMLRCAIAAGVHYRRTGQAPDTLDQLVPDLLSCIPDDPFTPGDPVRLARDGASWWLYSVGPDGIDQGGLSRYDPRSPAAGGDVLSFAERPSGPRAR